MARTHRLLCLGSPVLLGPGDEAVRFKTRKHLALLIYLAVEGPGPHPRERLAELLWESAGEVASRNSLATALSVLRARLGKDALESSQRGVSLSTDHLECDLERLAVGDFMPTGIMPALKVGGFLEDFDIPDAPSFGHWRDQQRAYWLPKITDALVKLMDRCRRRGEFADIEPLADCMLSLDDMNEAGMRAKMEARAFAGDRLSALRIYEQWKERLAENFDAEPSKMLEGIALRLRRRGWERENTREIPPVPTDHWRDRPFVGRGTEYVRLYEAWENISAKRASFVLITGDSGVGKSTLIGRLATAAGLEGAVVSRVHCGAMDQKIPYAALAGLVEELIGRPGAKATAAKALAELAVVVPQIHHEFPDLPEPQTTEGEAARIRLSEAMEELLTCVADEQPVVSVVDDIHHADDASVAVLHFLMRRLADARWLLLMASRTGELARIPSGRLLLEGNTIPQLQHQYLEPMGDLDAAALLSSLVADRDEVPDSTTSRALIRCSAGYPMALELLLTDWIENGSSCLALSLDAMTEELPTGGAPENTYGRAFERINQSLDQVTRNVMNLAAILGRRLNDLEMFALADLTLAQTMNGLTRLTELRVLRDTGRELEFVNELVRARAYLTVPSPLRRILHHHIADKLLQDERSGKYIPGLELAWHLIRSGRSDEAVTFLLKGSKEAIRRGAPNDAERALRSASPQFSDATQIRASLILIEAYVEQGKYKLAAELTDVLKSTVTNDDTTLLEAMSLETETARAATASKDRLKHALHLAASCKDSQLAARLVSATCRHLTRSFADTEIKKLAHETIATLTGTTIHPEARAHLFHAAARLAVSLHDPKEALSQVMRAQRTLEEANISNRLLSTILIGKGAIMLSRGRYQKALEALKEAEDRLASLGFMRSHELIGLNLSIAYGRLGDYDRQIWWAKKAHKSNGYRATYVAALGLALKSEYSEALSQLRSPIRFPSDPLSERWWLLRSADILSICGMDDEAEELATHALALRVARDPSCRGSYVRWTVRLFLDRHPKRVVAVVLDALHNAQSEDFLDHVEHLAIASQLEALDSNERNRANRKLHRLLNTVPKGAKAYLERLSVLESA